MADGMEGMEIGGGGGAVEDVVGGAAAAVAGEELSIVEGSGLEAPVAAPTVPAEEEVDLLMIGRGFMLAPLEGRPLTKQEIRDRKLVAKKVIKKGKRIVEGLRKKAKFANLGKIKMLGELLKEGEGLQTTLEGLKGSMVEVNRRIVGKQDEVDKLRRILGMKSGSGRGASSSSGGGSSAVPKMEGQGQGEGLPGNRKGELIFPEEIWVIIFAHLTDPQELRNCSISCPLFSRILHPRKTEFLFPLVLAQGCRGRYLDNSLMLSCRQVSQKWNEFVDQFLENHPSLLPFDENSFNPRDPDLAPPMRRNGYDFHRFSNRVGDLRENNFVDKMEYHPRNPFVGRSLSIQVYAPYVRPLVANGQPWDRGLRFAFLPVEEEHAGMVPFVDQQIQFWNSLFEILTLFGKHVSFLNLEVKGGVELLELCRQVYFRVMMRALLELAPNLKRLRIQGMIPLSCATGLNLPDVPLLESLEIDRMGNFYNPVSVQLVKKYHQQLKKLQVHWETWQYLYDKVGGRKLVWTNLVELHIEGIGGCLVTAPICNSNLPSLRKLYLGPGLIGDRFENVGQYEFDLERMMAVIAHLSRKTQLHVLRIYKGFEVREVVSAGAEWFAPPTLTTLEVEHCGEESDYSFLLRFPFLENLIVFWPEVDYYGRGGSEIHYKDVPMSDCGEGGTPKTGLGLELHQFMYEKRMYDCPIWELLPRLKIFTFQRDVYSRGGYEGYLKEKEASLAK